MVVLAPGSASQRCAPQCARDDGAEEVESNDVGFDAATSPLPQPNLPRHPGRSEAESREPGQRPRRLSWFPGLHRSAARRNAPGMTAARWRAWHTPHAVLYAPALKG